MQSRPFGRLGQVSALSLGGGGIGGVYGSVDRAEAIATLRAACDSGVTLIDLAPSYGPGERSPEAELLVGEAFGGRLPEAVLVTSKVVIEDPLPADAIVREVRKSLHETLARLGRDHVDLFFLHSHVRPPSLAPVPGTIGIAVVRDVVRQEFERLGEEGLIGAWGLTGTAHPDAICDLLCDEAKPAAVQSITNALDATGALWPFGANGRPDNLRIRTVAAAQGVSVMGIRPLAAGALADRLDRAPAADPVAAADHDRAGGFRALARAEGISAAHLAHRYALSLPDVATVIVGAKNRRELAECLAAEAAGPLSEDELAAVEASCAVGEQAWV